MGESAKYTVVGEEEEGGESANNRRRRRERFPFLLAATITHNPSQRAIHQKSVE